MFFVKIGVFIIPVGVKTEGKIIPVRINYQVTQITRPVFDVVCMRRSEKEPVPEM